MIKGRLHYFDTAKGIGIFLVLLGHLQGNWFFSLSPYILPLCTWIFSFHIPLFFLISGMLIRYKDDPAKDLKTLFLKRFKGIMIPYFWFSFFYLLVVLYSLLTGFIKPQSFFIQVWYVLGMYGMNVLWFLPALFFGEMLFLLLRSRFSDKILPFAILILTALATLADLFVKKWCPLIPDAFFAVRAEELFTTLLRPVFAAAFITIGYYAFALFRQREKANLVELLTAVALILLNIFVHPYNGGVDFRSLVQNNIALYYLCALSGSFGLILLCKNLPAIRPVTYWGVNSLIVMAVHNNETVLFYGMKLAMYANQFLTRARGYISYLIVVVTISLYVTLMIFLITRFFGFLIGKPSVFDRLFTRKNTEK